MLLSNNMADSCMSQSIGRNSEGYKYVLIYWIALSILKYNLVYLG